MVCLALNKTVLIITSSAGGGLLQAAVAQEQDVLSKNPHLKTIQCDVLKDWLGLLGKFSIQTWNTAQKKGDVFSQKFFVSFQWLFNYLAWPQAFFRTLNILLKENVDRVIDTQPSSTVAIMKAIRVFNWIRSKDLILEKLIVDLPTKKATHFFRPIKSLSKKDKKFLKLRTIPPLLENGQTAEDFWQSFCGMSESEVHYEDVNVRLPFKVLQGKSRGSASVSICLNAKNAEEIKLTHNALCKSNIHYCLEQDNVRFVIPENAKVVTILLGSQPASAATLNYVKNFVQLAKNTTKPLYLFVFCANLQDDTHSLFRKVSELVASVPDYPEQLTVIPFSFQTDAVIASLFHRSDITISRSGGGTAMELMAVSTGAIWIHSEARKKNRQLTLKELLSGIPVWESESANYLLKLRGAKIVTPDTFMEENLDILR